MIHSDGTIDLFADDVVKTTYLGVRYCIMSKGEQYVKGGGQYEWVRYCIMSRGEQYVKGGAIEGPQNKNVCR